MPVGKATAAPLVAKLIPKVRDLKNGAGFESEAETGPLVTRQHLYKVEGCIAAGVKEAGDLLVGGRGLPGHEGGYFIGGSLLDRVTSDMTIYKE